MENLPLDLKKDLLLRLDDKELVKICQLNKEYIDFCNNNQDFWLQRIIRTFPYLNIEILNQYKGARTWSQYYIEDLRKINNNNAEDYLINAIDDERFDHIMIAIDKGADPNEISILYDAGRNDDKNLLYLSKFILKNVNIDIISDELFKSIGEMDIDGLDNVLTTKLKNTNIKQLCENIYYKMKNKFRDTFGSENYGDLLITMLFNPDLGLVRMYNNEIENQRVLLRAFELIISKIDTPEIFPDLYQDFLEDTPGINKYVLNALDVSADERQTVIEALKNINVSLSDIKSNNLTDEEALLVLLIFTRFRKGSYRLESSWLNVCKNI